MINQFDRARCFNFKLRSSQQKTNRTKMKINKLTLAVALGLGLTEMCNAGTVYMTGSTAMRSTVYAALIAPGVVFTAAPQYTVWQGGTTGNNAGNGGNYMAFVGTLVGGSGSTTIQCHWTGSEGGIADVANGNQNTFMTSGSINGADNGTNVPPTVSASVNLAMGDNAQSFSRTKSPVVTKSHEVGIITFKWVRNNGLWQGTNVTDSQIRQCLSSGSCPLAVFSGSSSDTNTYIYASGRDNQSGTRVNAYGISGFGILSTPNQIQINKADGTMIDQTGGGTYDGDYGWSSGGTLAGTLGVSTKTVNDPQNGTVSGQGYSVIAYLSVGDAGTAITAGATELTYNGVLFSSAAVKEGTYGFWGNEYIYEANGTQGAESDSVYTKLSATTGINSYCDGTKAIKLTDMHCTRSGPTSDPLHN
jgi:hypothetical protein